MALVFHQEANSHSYGYCTLRSSSTDFRRHRPSWRIGEFPSAGNGRHRNLDSECCCRVAGSIRRHGKTRSAGSAYSSDTA